MAGSTCTRSAWAVLPLVLAASGALAQQQGADPIATCRSIVAAADRIAGPKPVAGADYVPGVDIRGNPVAPADVNPQPNFLPAEIVLPVQPDAFAFLGRVPPRGLDVLRANVGELRIRLSDGQTTFNGQPLGAASAELIAACRQLLAATPTP